MLTEEDREKLAELRESVSFLRLVSDLPNWLQGLCEDMGWLISKVDIVKENTDGAKTALHAKVLGYRYGLKARHKPLSVINAATSIHEFVSPEYELDDVRRLESEALEYLIENSRFNKSQVVSMLQMIHGILQHAEERDAPDS